MTRLQRSQASIVNVLTGLFRRRRIIIRGEMANLYHITIFFAHVLFLLPCSRAAVIAQPCTHPRLDNGFLYSVEQQQPGRPSVMNYRCNEGFKPVTGGWWSTITCKKGRWQPAPRCIASSACTPPQVSNGGIGGNEEEYYSNEKHVLVNCDDGYVPQANYVQCREGKWEPLPVCQRSQNSCSAPPERPNAVIKVYYKDIFNHGDRVQYHCMDEYKMNGDSYSHCDQGKWTEAGECGQRCPDPPSIQHGDIVTVSSDNNTVTYHCANYYKNNGTAKITCRNGQWSTTPSCEANYCKVAGKVEYLMPLASAKFINGGGEETFQCEDRSYQNWYYRTAEGTCENGRVTFRGCAFGLVWTIRSAE
ncbi:complement factor H-related protein 1-like isoform X2 [Engraulis encrasicolus]|uniref:complement factor H-related protein 1-like isoform X2 n=1 Tax=Engraulis encrasicolus TaxID=184585 RepID=UPI002FD7320E